MKTSSPKPFTENYIFSVDDAFQIKDISSPAFSPDGTYIACVVTVPSLDENTRTDYIALILVNKKEIQYVTKGSSPCWSPDGKHIAYNSEQDGKSGIWLYNVQSRDNRFLAPVYSSNYFMGHRAEKNISWSPDGQKIAYLNTKPHTRSKENNVRVFNNLLYKTKGGQGRPLYSDPYHTHVYIVSIEDGEPEWITEGDYNEHSLSWSPDSQYITFISNRSLNRDYNHLNNVWYVEIKTKETTQLTNDKGTEFNPKWSPDGNYIAFLATESLINTKDSQADDTQLHVISAEGDNPKCLTKTFDRRIESISWHPGSDFIYFTAGDKGRTGIYKVSPDTNDIETIIDGPFHILEYSLSADGEKIAYIKTDTTHPSELYLYKKSTKKNIRITDNNKSLLDKIHLQGAEMFWFESFDHTNVQGWIMKPSNFEAAKTYPLILVIHGGPHNMFGYEFEARMQLLASYGYGVLFINPRGSSGYGQNFSNGCIKNWGGGDYKDLMHGVDHVINTCDWIDEKKLGVTGQSYGGYMTNWIITQTHRFKAAVVDGGISNLISFTGTSLYHLLLESEFNGAPWNNYPLLWQWSPLRNVKNVTTPTLFLHGETDNEVPTSQAEEMYTALKKRNIETTFVHYIGEGHGWRPDLKPQNRHDLYKRTINWFDTHIK